MHKLYNVVCLRLRLARLPVKLRFYRAMLCFACTMLSQNVICLSHAGILSKRLNLSSNFFHRRVDTSRILHCVPKKRDHIFHYMLKQNCPFTKIFGTLITKSIGHRQVFLVSHFTYLVQLLYLGKLSRPKHHKFSLKLLIFSMLQY